MATKNTETVQQAQAANTAPAAGFTAGPPQGETAPAGGSALHAVKSVGATLPALGSTCNVRVAAGVVLRNNDTGAHFEPEVDTPVTVTVTLLRRIQDGDVTLVD